MVQLASQSTLRSSSRRLARSFALMSVVIVVVPIVQARRSLLTAGAGSVAERLLGPDETPPVEEYDPVGLDRQTHSRTPANFRQRPDHDPNRLGAGGIIHNVHPFVELAVLVPSRLLELLKARFGDAAIKLRRW